MYVCMYRRSIKQEEEEEEEERERENAGKLTLLPSRGFYVHIDKHLLLKESPKEGKNVRKKGRPRHAGEACMHAYHTIPYILARH